jgi:hypothetical protein
MAELSCICKTWLKILFSTNTLNLRKIKLKSLHLSFFVILENKKTKKRPIYPPFLVVLDLRNYVSTHEVVELTCFCKSRLTVLFSTNTLNLWKVKLKSHPLSIFEFLENKETKKRPIYAPFLEVLDLRNYVSTHVELELTSIWMTCLTVLFSRNTLNLWRVKLKSLHISFFVILVF